MTDIDALESKLKNKQQQLIYLQQSIKTDTEQLNKLKENKAKQEAKAQETRLQAIEQDIKAINEKQFLTLDCQENMGLHNKICTAPYAKCELHNCLLSYKNVRRRRCVMKMCRHLEYV